MGLIGAGAKVVAQCKHSFEFLRPSGQATADRNGVGLAAGALRTVRSVGD